MIYLYKEQIIKINQRVVERTNEEFRLRDEFILLDCCEKPSEILFNKETFDSVQKKAAAYLFYLNSRHPFVEGNKRTTFLSFIYFLSQNNYSAFIYEEDIVNFSYSIAKGEQTIESTIEWVENFVIKVD